MPPLHVVVSAFAPFPKTYQSLTFSDIERYLHVARNMKSEISLHMNGLIDAPPIALPSYIHQVIRDAMGLQESAAVECWAALREVVWNEEPVVLSVDEARAIQTHGMGSVHAVERICEHPSRFPAVYYSFRHGARACYATSLSCTACKIRYHHNYYTEDEARVYYKGSPSVIQFEEHGFMDSQLAELFTSFMLMAWYPSPWPQMFHLDSEQVWRAFYLNALLRDADEHGDSLVLPSVGSQDSRLQYGMARRNEQMVIEGQPEVMHACNLWPLRAVVTDGISLGHPCCAVHNCTTPLSSNRDHFCLDHTSQALICVVTDCTQPAQDGCRTCSNRAHRQLEDARTAQKTAFFQLQQRLKKSNVFQPINSLKSGADMSPDVDGDQDLDLDLDSELYTTSREVPKSDEGNRKPKARFARRRTHNEQLVVCCCGVIAARATMFGAEAISGVKDFLKSVYPHPSRLPEVIFYDNNCQFLRHLRAQGDFYFDEVILPVDVFHFKSKHKETDEFCQTYCNPALWPELSDGEGNWIFNSSAAEQANVWMGGYLAMVREMLAYRYDFFLDEMIKRRNERIVERLDKQEMVPYHVPYV
ncbi:hypothetical protein FA95DRAFT_1492972 [Auriscalpium vulgare]|uniref:Uncharacterized protein n=1 Tax=Auriscalpium vulgare TaxID=40419 RepID=A0ACB8RTK4_9AGAM|nr:hypothetical protein FA95DRAFT_1492972 [Auriscalpium vulgare]